MTYHQLNNISLFLRAAKAIGVPDSESFDTLDLHDARDLSTVVTCVLALKDTVSGGGGGSGRASSTGSFGASGAAGAADALAVADERTQKFSNLGRVSDDDRLPTMFRRKASEPQRGSSSEPSRVAWSSTKMECAANERA